MAVFQGFYALGTGVSNQGVFTEAIGYTRPVVALTGTAVGGLTQAIGQITGPTGPVGSKLSEGAIFDAPVSGNCLCRWHWTLRTTIPANFAAITVSFSFLDAIAMALNLSSIGGGGSSGSAVDQGSQIGWVNGNPLLASTRLSLQSGALVALITVPAPTVVMIPQVVTVGSSVPMTGTMMLVNKTIGSATAVSLSQGASPWVIYTIKDYKGDAATNNITVTPSSGLIDGAASFVININYMAASLVFDGTNWSIV